MDEGESQLQARIQELEQQLADANETIRDLQEQLEDGEKPKPQLGGFSMKNDSKPMTNGEIRQEIRNYLSTMNIQGGGDIVVTHQKGSLLFTIGTKTGT